MDDKNIIKLFFIRSEEALKIMSERFGKTIYRIALNILGNHHDAQVTTNDTYLALWNAIPPKEPDPLAPYVFRTSRNMALKKLEYLTAEKRNNRYDLSLDELSFCLPDENAEHLIDSQEIAECINSFLDKDTAKNRYMFLRRYWYGDGVEEIAKELNMKSGTVSVQLTRIRTRLKEYLIKEGFFYEA